MLDLNLFFCNINITETFLISHSVIVLFNNSMGACNIKNSIHSLQIFSQKYFPALMKAPLCGEECEISPALMGTGTDGCSFVILAKASALVIPFFLPDALGTTA